MTRFSAYIAKLYQCSYCHETILAACCLGVLPNPVGYVYLTIVSKVCMFFVLFGVSMTVCLEARVKGASVTFPDRRVLFYSSEVCMRVVSFCSSVTILRNLL